MLCYNPIHFNFQSGNGMEMSVLLCYTYDKADVWDLGSRRFIDKAQKYSGNGSV